MNTKRSLKKEKVDFPVKTAVYTCGICGRKILVEQALFGVNHTFATHVTCWDCLPDDRKKWAAKRYKLK